jgi:hypothetical protein
MAKNSKHMASIISSAFITSKRNDNIVSTFAVDFNNNNVQKQHWEDMEV